MVEEARSFAEKAHEGQFRKGTKRPYIVHPLEVAKIVSTMTDDEEMISAALLHDTLEDCRQVTKEQIKEAFGERVAMNTPIQGTAADIIKKAMIDTAKALRENGMQSRLILQIHDELIVESPQAETERAAALLQTCMERAFTLRVPLVAETHVGKTWYDAKG